MDVTLYHNPACSNSRRCLEILRDGGVEPRIVEYLKTPLTAPELRALLRTMNAPPRDIVRFKEPEAAALDPETSSEDTLIAALAAHPILLNRPIVITAKGARLCRAPEVVLELLADTQGSQRA